MKKILLGLIFLIPMQAYSNYDGSHDRECISEDLKIRLVIQTDRYLGGAEEFHHISHNYFLTSVEVNNKVILTDENKKVFCNNGFVGKIVCEIDQFTLELETYKLSKSSHYDTYYGFDSVIVNQQNEYLTPDKQRRTSDLTCNLL